jgi:Lung seven transmembrane receptor
MEVYDSFSLICIFRPDLGSAFGVIQLLTGLHFLTGILNAFSNFIYANVETIHYIIFSSPYILLSAMICILTLCEFNRTKGQLQNRNQSSKLRLFTRLGFILRYSFLSSLLMTGITLFVHFYFISNVNWIGGHWTSIWFLIEGWPELHYLVTMIAIAWVVRPRSDNKRYGLEALPSTSQPDEESGLFSFRWFPAFFETNSDTSSITSYPIEPEDLSAGRSHVPTRPRNTRASRYLPPLYGTCPSQPSLDSESSQSTSSSSANFSRGSSTAILPKTSDESSHAQPLVISPSPWDSSFDGNSTLSSTDDLPLNDSSITIPQTS